MRRKKVPGYGTQEEIAEERAELNREAPGLDEEDEDHREEVSCKWRWR